MRRVGFLIWKELIELKEDPRLFGIVIAAPILQLLVLGYAATTDVRHVPVVVADADRSTASRDLIARFAASPNFTIVGVVTSPHEVDPYLERSTAWMALAIPPGYGETLARARPQALQILADGSDANSTTIALGYATNLIAAYGEEMAARRLAAASLAGEGSPTPGGLEPRVRVWFNPIVGKLLPYALVGMIDVCLVLAIVVLWFAVPLRGSVLLLFALTSVYLLSTLGLGLFVSTISATQQQAMMTSTFFFLTPMIYLSGFIFPIENMPAAIQLITYLIPLRYFLVILRSIFLKGAGLEVLWPQALALTTWGVVMLGLAIARSTKRVT